MEKSDKMLDFMGKLVKMQKAKMMKDLGLPTAEILKFMDLSQTLLNDIEDDKDQCKRSLEEAHKKIATQMKKLNL